MALALNKIIVSGLSSDADGAYFDYGTHVYSKTGIAALDEFLISSLSSENCIIEDTMI